MRLKLADRLLWAWLSRVWPQWRNALVIVQPQTVIRWQRKRFRDHWTRLSRRGKPGRPRVAKEIRDLIRRMSVANPTWGSPHIEGELLKLGIKVSKSTVRSAGSIIDTSGGPPELDFAIASPGRRAAENLRAGFVHPAVAGTA